MAAQLLMLLRLLALLHVAQAHNQKSLELSDILPKDRKSYDKMMPPKKDGEPTVVHLRLRVLSLSSINEYAMSYVADVFFFQTWIDNRLQLPENITSESRLLDVDWLKQIWKPDVFFKNAEHVTLQIVNTPNHMLRLYENQTILYMVKLTLKLSCEMNFLIYPHDTQECKLQMQSFAHTTEDVIFKWNTDTEPLVVHRDIELPQFELVTSHVADCTRSYTMGNYTCLEAIFVLKRCLGDYIFHTYIPTCLIVIMSWISFWIKPEIAPARVTLGVTAVLTLSTQYAKSQATLPPVSYLMALDAFMSVCTVFVFMALMEYCLVHILLNHDSVQTVNPSSSSPPPASFDNPDSAARDKISDIATEKNAVLMIDQSQKSTTPPLLEPTLVQQTRTRALKIDRASRVIFPLLFAVLNIIYWTTLAVYINLE